MDKKHFEQIPLEVAMTMDLPYNWRIWEVAGFHVSIPKDIPKNAENKRTSIQKTREGNFSIIIYWKEKQKETWRQICTFSELKEMKDTFPKLFELEGSFLTF